MQSHYILHPLVQKMTHLDPHIITSPPLDTPPAIICDYSNKHDAFCPSVCILLLVFYRSLSCCVVFPVRAAATRCLCSTKWVSWTWSSSVWRDTHRTWNWPFLLVGRVNILLTGCHDLFQQLLKRFLCTLKQLDALYKRRNSLVALV